MSKLQWISRADSRTDLAMEKQGLFRVRTLYQMRRSLPLEEELLSQTRQIELRAFRPGVDDAEFLRVNNRAFAWHPEQGGWTMRTLQDEMSEPWFDADGFLLHDSEAKSADGSTATSSADASIGQHNLSIDGFCWTKVHSASGDDPPMGEIYVIAADPSAHGTGLGRALTVGGLNYLHSLGLEVGMLYVEHDNVAAVELYEKLGFHVDHEHVAYSPAEGTPPR